MKFKIVLVLILISNWSYAQDFYGQFIKACEEKDSSMQVALLDQWEAEEPNDPELFTSRFNYHFQNSQTEVLELSSNAPNGDGMVLQDNSGKDAGFIGSKIIFDENEVNKSFMYIDKGIKNHPDRLDMRFGKVYAYGQLEDWDSFTDEIIKTIKYASTKSTPWLWTNGEVQEGDDDFLFSVIQDYQFQLYNTEDDKLLVNMREIANAILEVNPNHVESLSNLSITHTLLGEYSKAITPLLKAETIDPDDYIVIANIANTYKEMKEFDKSIVYYKKLMKFDVDGVADFAKEQVELLEKSK